MRWESLGATRTLRTWEPGCSWNGWHHSDFPSGCNPVPLIMKKENKSEAILNFASNAFKNQDFIFWKKNSYFQPTYSHFHLLARDVSVWVVVVEGEHEGGGHPGDLVFDILSGGFGMRSLLHEEEWKTWAIKWHEKERMLRPSSHERFWHPILR